MVMKFILQSLLGVLSPLSFMLLVWRKGEFVGTDQIGNKYYRGTARKGYNHDRRWVVYKDEPQASAVPPEWHGWLHHQTDAVPTSDGTSFRKPWQIGWRPNLTGTELAYRPPGHELSGGKRAKATGDYQAWRPEQ
jgi:NADH:ubiquinone oxidoreductase subunit